MHARLMIEGFMGAFVLGFLGTAVPRLTGTSVLSRKELFSVLALHVVVVAVHIAERYPIADAIFLLLLLVFATFMVRRFRAKSDLPPPSFVLVGFGFLNAILGTLLLVLSGVGQVSPALHLFGNALLYQGFVLYLLLGVGGHLMPRFLALSHKESLETGELSPEWWRKTAIALVVGMLLFATFALEVFTTWIGFSAWLRFGAVAVFLFWQIPVNRSKARTTLARCLKLSLVLLVLGLCFPGFWPTQRVAGLHLVFIGGFTLISFSVATRVVLGHSNQSHFFATRLPFLIATAVLLVISAALRIIGDFTLGVRGPVLNYASYLWMFAAAFWAWRLLPSVRVPDSED